MQGVFFALMVNEKKIKPLKKFSQNFLQNIYLADKIIESLNCESNDIVVEIGGGTGILTERLVQQKCKSLIVIEVDRRLVRLLEERFSDNLSIIQNSFLKMSIAQFAGVDRIKVVGNIPYHITSDIIFKLIDNSRYLRCAVLMVQKEVAERLVALPASKDYGLLTIFTGLYCSVQKLFDVDRDNFYPIPNVDSSVIILDFDKSHDESVDYQLFKKIVRAGFSVRRKMLRNSLKKVFPENVLKSITSVALNRRPEELSIEEFKVLTKELSSTME
jgi:16S rRNA (adenine1518-N6/adenine1519-N6)-dimethyltransferase